MLGPGAITPAVRAIIIANVAAFVLTLFSPRVIIELFGLSPRAVLEHGHVWQLVTYLFIHDVNSIMHILFNMLAVWMFGVDLERRWGTREFLRYYFITGVGAGICMILVALLPWQDTRATYDVVTIGASGAVYGLILAWAVIYPHRQILFMLIFPLSARAFAWIMGAIAFTAALASSQSPVANVAHLGGLLIGYVYLKGMKNMSLDFRYRVTKWRMNRMRRRFNLHQGGQDDWERRIH